MDADRKRIEELVADANAPALSETPPRGRFIVLAVALAAIAGLAYLAARAPSLWDAPLPFAGIVCALVIVVATLTIYAPMRPLAPGASAEEAVGYFHRALLAHKWWSAFTVVSPLGRQRDASRPAIPEVGVRAASGALASPRALEEHWTGLVYETRRKRVRRFHIDSLGAVGDQLEAFHIKMEVVITRGSEIDWGIKIVNLIEHLAAGSDVVSLEYGVVAVRHRSRWFMLTGAFSPELDMALIQEAGLSFPAAASCSKLVS